MILWCSKELRLRLKDNLGAEKGNSGSNHEFSRGEVFLEPMISISISIFTTTTRSPNRIPPESLQVAYSPRILRHLIRTGKLPPSSMALATVEPGLSFPKEKEIRVQSAPEVVTTPCDPWPRPYYLEDGLRRVYPYHFTYNTFCKERWRGRGILDIFASEFRDRPAEYYVCVDWLCNMVMKAHVESNARCSKRPLRLERCS